MTVTPPPDAFAQYIRRRNTDLRKIRRSLKTGKAILYNDDVLCDVEPITVDHPDERVRNIAVAYQQMLEHPLAKKYLRTPQELYLVKDRAYASLPNVSNTHNKYIAITERDLEIYSLAHIKLSIGHELGESMMLSIHPRRHDPRRPELSFTHRTIKRPGQNPPFICPDSQWKESLCDVIGLILSREPEAAKTHINEIQKAIKNAHRERGNEILAQMQSNPTPLYYDEDVRQKILADEADRVMTQGYALLEEQVGKALDIEHRNLFAHHHSRTGGVTRG